MAAGGTPLAVDANLARATGQPPGGERVRLTFLPLKGSQATERTQLSYVEHEGRH